eukprot:CAMPEP_0116843692 /NCGR_PEP_ID=MMETSP0418-20121206/12232_1 /TAXON_ID=1158023 /ORGANISM="Astrosyne radiata, Strain 13vi08-1A" /LENGTH=263 /DNA_ID=CAMNT_0004474479 /DNA_START=44 /DNA_END=836 /DNA_ORIENTATION=+
MTIQIAVNKQHCLLGTEAFSSPEFDSTLRNKPVEKSVSFSEVVNVFLTPHCNDMNDEEYFKTWYQEREFRNMKLECAQTVEEITMRIYDGDDENQCKRGLETRTKDGARRRTRNKRRARFAVLSEQQRQNSCGIQDDESLRFVYMKASHRSVAAAEQIGLADAMEALTIYEDRHMTDEVTTEGREHLAEPLWDIPSVRSQEARSPMSKWRGSDSVYQNVHARPMTQWPDLHPQTTRGSTATTTMPLCGRDFGGNLVLVQVRHF